MWLTPSSTAFWRTSIDWFRSLGVPSALLMSRMAPNPSRLTVRSPSCHVPALPALVVMTSACCRGCPAAGFGNFLPTLAAGWRRGETGGMSPSVLPDEEELLARTSHLFATAGEVMCAARDLNTWALTRTAPEPVSTPTVRKMYQPASLLNPAMTEHLRLLE